MEVSYTQWDGVGVAGGPGQVRRRGAGVDVDFLLLLGDAGDGERTAGIRHFDDQIDAVTVEPLTGDGGADVGLVQMIGGQDLDVPVLAGNAVFVQRLVHRRDGVGPGEILVRPRQISQAADFQRLRVLCLGASKGRCRGGGREQAPAGQLYHDVSSLVQTPRYSCSLSMLASSSEFSILSTILPRSMT